jgi:Collagen triple helix repeat (20 copies)
MLSFVRKRFTFGNVALTLALVFAMSGGAFAAGKFLITSTKQISPKVLAQLKGAKGANGVAGAQGPQGPAGAKGETGPKGETGAKGEQGVQGSPGTNGASVTNTKVEPGEPECEERGGAKLKVASGASTFACNGKQGSPWAAGGTLPSGASETGNWSAVLGPGVAGPNKEFGFAVPSLSFTIGLAVAIPSEHVEIKEVGYDGSDKTGEEHEQCPGTAEVPEAKAGFVCIYTFQDGTEAKEKSVTTTNPAGVVFFIRGEHIGFVTYGTWAVTAP